MGKPLRLLMIEDSEDDALLTILALKKGGYDPLYERVEDAGAMRKALLEKLWDVILCDYQMPQFNGPAAIAILKETGIDIPLIIVSGAIGEETAVECMRLGASDYIMKDKLSRLVSAIERELKEADSRLQRKDAEAALQAKNEEIRAISQQLLQTEKLATVGELASSIAHELNNPLTTISLSVELLIAKTPVDDPRQRKLEIIGHEIERMGNLVSNLLQFSRRSQPQISTVNVCDEIEKTLELIHYHLRKRNISVAREFKPEGPLVHADRQQLRQLFLNLFTNASDAMPEGGTLTIRVFKQGSEIRDQGSGKAFVVIEIADTGVGIPPEILPKVLEPFYTTKPEGKGTGLGLAICRRIAEGHGGTFGITSEGCPGKGTRVCINLPFSNGSNTASLKEE